MFRSRAKAKIYFQSLILSGSFHFYSSSSDHTVLGLKLFSRVFWVCSQTFQTDIFKATCPQEHTCNWSLYLCTLYNGHWNLCISYNIRIVFCPHSPHSLRSHDIEHPEHQWHYGWKKMVIWILQLSFSKQCFCFEIKGGLLPLLLSKRLTFFCIFRLTAPLCVND